MAHGKISVWLAVAAVACEGVLLPRVADLYAATLPKDLYFEDDPSASPLFQSAAGADRQELEARDKASFFPFCGATGCLLPSDFYSRVGLPIVRIDLAVRQAGGTESSDYCTGVLLSDKYVMTNYHCIPGRNRTIEQARIVLNYLTFKQRPTQTQPYAKCKLGAKPVSEQGKINGSEDLDYSIVEVLGGDDCNLAPFASTFQVAPHDPKRGERLLIVQHPQMRPKRKPLAECTANEPNEGSGEFLHNCATDRGSSGAPVFSASEPYKWFGLHYRGPDSTLGQQDAPGAVRAIDIFQHSTILQRIRREQLARDPRAIAANSPIPVSGSDDQRRQRVAVLQTNLQSMGSDDVFKVVSARWPKPRIAALELDYKETFQITSGKVVSETAGASLIEFKILDDAVWSVKRTDSYAARRPQNQNLKIDSMTEGVNTLAGLLEVYGDHSSRTAGTVLDNLEFNAIDASSRKLQDVKISPDAKFPERVGDAVTFEYKHCVIINGLPCAMTSKSVTVRMIRQGSHPIAGRVNVLTVTYGDDNPAVRLTREYDFSPDLGCFVGAREQVFVEGGSFKNETRLTRVHR